MGTVPIQTETPGIQELYTRDHGTIKVDKVSFQDGGYHIVRCPNGAYMHANGLPIKDEKELRAAIPKEFLQPALDWFNRRHEFEENPPRPIGFNSENVPVFADGSIADFADLYAFFKPGPILSAAIVALQQFKDRQTGETVKTDAKPPVKTPEKTAAPGPEPSKKTVKKPGKKATKTSKAKPQPEAGAVPA